MAPQGETPSWEKDGRDWPNRTASRFVEAGGLNWHVQLMGQGPCLLLLHGTAAATHSWRDLAPLLAPHFTLIAPDLPGHGFTSSLPQARVSLAGFSEALRALLNKLQASPDLVLGHSAGAAIALRMALDGAITPRAIFSLNGALLPLGDEHAAFFTRAARLMVGCPLSPSFVPGGLPSMKSRPSCCAIRVQILGRAALNFILGYSAIPAIFARR